MKILRRISRGVFNRLLLGVTFLGGLVRLKARVRELEEALQVLRAAEAGHQERDWVNATMISSLKERLAELEVESIRSPGDEDEIVVLRRRVRDLEDYIRLGRESEGA